MKNKTKNIIQKYLFGGLAIALFSSYPSKFCEKDKQFD